MRGFISAIQFLTIIPIGTRMAISPRRLSSATTYFPLVGLLLGLILVGINSFLSAMMVDPFLIKVVLIILLIILTGGLHLDGLADTVDAFGSRKSRTDILKIMRDSHIGTMGVLGLVSVILLKIALLNAINPKVLNISLVLMCILSRYSLVLSLYLFRYGRQEGKAKVFAKNTTPRIFIIATIMTLFFAIVILKLTGFAIFILTAIFAFLIGLFVLKRIAGITGDTLGATNELTEIFVLMLILISTGG